MSYRRYADLVPPHMRTLIDEARSQVDRARGKGAKMETRKLKVMQVWSVVGKVVQEDGKPWSGTQVSFVAEDYEDARDLAPAALLHHAPRRSTVKGISSLEVKDEVVVRPAGRIIYGDLI